MRRITLTTLFLAALAAVTTACSDGPLAPEPPVAVDAAVAVEKADASSKKGPKPAGGPPAAGDVVGEALFGPERMVRGAGKPVAERRTIDLDGWGAPYAVRVRNGDAAGRKRVSSAEVRVDGERVLGPSDFSPRAGEFVIPVEASGSLALEAELRGGPGSELTVWVHGIPLPAAVTVTPAEAVLVSLGETAALAATVFGPTGQTLDEPVTWTSSDDAVAMVDQDGLVTAVGSGQATITAAAGGVSGSAQVTVDLESEEESPPAASFVDVVLATTTITIDGGLVSYTVTLDNPGGEALTGVVVQAWAEQEGTSKPAGGHSVFCGLDTGVGVLPPGGCTDDMTLNVGNSSPHGTGTLVPGPATVRFDLTQGGSLLDTFTVEVTLVSSEGGG